ncbi:glycosyl transferase family 1 [Paraburkholderia sp. BL6665CI2N2]|uniref:glycosyltransferase family 4 protein n=1 Tax=Paraburkholderia sp. BL6665CI2N2 TaxID=1938806 RepID=UPI0010652DC7|nr:glycosyltransferase family 4 protein [Paraburkholderia sp. BL6665CI2N2]TDY25209.1 glycosyl transferase family 1 [Paraburkholderia sp. BL6665CI2N2]
METNELSARALGGTEAMLAALHARLDPELARHFQIIPSRARQLAADRKRIFWLHDTPSEEEAKFLASPDNLARFDGLVCVSHYQACLYNLIPQVPYRKMVVLQNAIEPFGAYRPRRGATIRLIYHTTPHRGLEILVPVFEHLAKVHPDIELDVFSSFNIYGWAQRDEPYRQLFDRCRAHPRIRYHGAQPNHVVRETLRDCDIFAYPSIWPETSCVAAIEALSSGCLVICPAYGALPETCANFASLYPFTEDRQSHAERFCLALDAAIRAVKRRAHEDATARSFQVDYFNRFYSWDRRITEWNAYLRGLLS